MAKVLLEACTLCQLDCRGCYIRDGTNKSWMDSGTSACGQPKPFGNKSNISGLGAGYLKFENFVKFIDKNPFVKEIELSRNGEIFLNPDLAGIIKYARENNVEITAYGGNNFNDVSDEAMEALVKYGVKGLTVSLDGSSQKAYSWYRRGGDFGKVIENVKKLNRYKKRYNSDRPDLRWQYIIFPSNDDKEEIRRAKKMARELGMYIYFQRDRAGYVPEDVAIVREETGLTFRDGVEYMLNSGLRTRWCGCFSMWEMPLVNWDGRFLGCGINFYDGTFGTNVFIDGLEKALSSKKYKDMKKMAMGKKFRKDLPCFECWVYRNILKYNDFVRPEEVEK